MVELLYKLYIYINIIIIPLNSSISMTSQHQDWSLVFLYSFTHHILWITFHYMHAHIIQLHIILIQKKNIKISISPKFSRKKKKNM